MTQHVKRFERNTLGRDFVVGDIHGCFEALEDCLNQIGFDGTIDRLFSVGDLVDRGPASELALEWLAKPWFHAVRGNHEEMAILFATGEMRTDVYLANGGAWFVAKDKNEQFPYVDAFDKLPYAIEVETDKGLVGIVHAECPFVRWSDIEPALASENGETFKQMMVWSRDRIDNDDRRPVLGVVAVFVGHTPQTEPVRLGNVFYIDTGACFRQLGVLTLVNLAELDLSDDTEDMSPAVSPA
jgi:serine/threonine protein phosphatase 1